MCTKCVCAKFAIHAFKRENNKTHLRTIYNRYFDLVLWCQMCVCLHIVYIFTMLYELYAQYVFLALRFKCTHKAQWQ